MNSGDIKISDSARLAVTFPPSGGEMGKRIRTLDWTATPLGPIEEWPQSLRTVVNILLSSRYAMWMAWGPDLTFLCNDAYRPTLGIKDPWALGARADRVWAEIWPDIGPRIETVLTTGEATYDEGLLLFLERSGFPEETYHTFSYSPLADDHGRINGMLCVVTEETERILGERRVETLRDVASALASTNTEGEVLQALRDQFGKNKKDLPFTLTYLFDEQVNARDWHPPPASRPIIRWPPSDWSPTRHFRGLRRRSSSVLFRVIEDLSERSESSGADGRLEQARRTGRGGADPAAGAGAAGGIPGGRHQSVPALRCGLQRICRSAGRARSPPGWPTRGPMKRNAAAPNRWPKSIAPRPRSFRM